jgi:hypothetical protein
MRVTLKVAACAGLDSKMATKRQLRDFIMGTPKVYKLTLATVHLSSV